MAALNVKLEEAALARPSLYGFLGGATFPSGKAQTLRSRWVPQRYGTTDIGIPDVRHSGYLGSVWRMGACVPGLPVAGDEKVSEPRLPLHASGFTLTKGLGHGQALDEASLAGVEAARFQRDILGPALRSVTAPDPASAEPTHRNQPAAQLPRQRLSSNRPLR